MADNRDIITREVKKMATNNPKKESLSQESHQGIDVSMADSLVFDNAIIADNAPDSEIFSADNMTIQAENRPDSMVSEEGRRTDDNKNFEKIYGNYNDPKTLAQLVIQTL
jgi:hypothetical protein